MKLFIGIVALMSLVACSPSPPPNCNRVIVTTVYEETCTIQAKYPECRVELSNGVRVNIEAPIMQDDILVGCQRSGERNVRLWRVETTYRSGFATIGHYRN